MRLTGEEIDAAALQLWREVFAAQCALPIRGICTTDFVRRAKHIADFAEETFRDRCKESK